MRTITALIVSGAFAPVVFMALLGLLSAIASSGADPPSSATSGRVSELVGLMLVALVLGGPISIAVALFVGLPGIWLARWLRLASLPMFGASGSILALGCTARFAWEDIASSNWSRLPDWGEFGAVAALTGALCGVVCWLIAERGRRPVALG